MAIKIIRICDYCGKEIMEKHPERDGQITVTTILRTVKFTCGDKSCQEKDLQEEIRKAKYLAWFASSARLHAR